MLQIFFTGLRLQPAPGTEGEARKKWVDVMQPENEGMVSQRVRPPRPCHLLVAHTGWDQSGLSVQWCMLVRMKGRLPLFL